MTWIAYEPRDFTKLDYDRREEIKPLSKRELAWVNRLQKTLLACPTKRLALVTTGDKRLEVIDDKITKKYHLELCDGYAELNGLVLAVVEGAPTIHGVSG